MQVTFKISRRLQPAARPEMKRDLEMTQTSMQKNNTTHAYLKVRFAENLTSWLKCTVYRNLKFISHSSVYRIERILLVLQTKRRTQRVRVLVYRTSGRRKSVSETSACGTWKRTAYIHLWILGSKVVNCWGLSLNVDVKSIVCLHSKVDVRHPEHGPAIQLNVFAVHVLVHPLQFL